MRNILVFTTAIEHTTHRKAAILLANEGANVSLAGFTRNNFPASKIENIAVYQLGTISHGSYLTRIMKAFKSLHKIRDLAKEQEVIYCFTLDGLIISSLALFFIKKKWVYQVQDIRPIYFGNGLKNKLARFLEKWMLKKVDLLVVSSKEYYTGHFKPLYNFDDEKVRVIENKLPRDFVVKSEQTKEKRKVLVIGYFGVLRCLRSWEILYQLARNAPNDINLLLRGKPDAMPNLDEQIIGDKNITYGGLYKSPDDLHSLYSAVDIVWACYPYSEERYGNWKLARTIRFYEALAYAKPVIVQKGTAQEKDVLKYNIGLVIDMSAPDTVLESLQAITSDMLDDWKRNIAELPRNYLFHNDEHQKLLKAINEL